MARFCVSHQFWIPFGACACHRPTQNGPATRSVTVRRGVGDVVLGLRFAVLGVECGGDAHREVHRVAGSALAAPAGFGVDGLEYRITLGAGGRDRDGCGAHKTARISIDHAWSSANPA